MSEYIVIPIFSDNFLHPLHKNNSLSLLYVKKIGEDSQILTFNHLDKLQEDNFEFLKDKTILTPNKKFLLYVYPFKKVYDINMLHYYIHNKPIDDDFSNNAIEFLYNRYHDVGDINTVVPMLKHQQYCDNIAENLESIWKIRDKINFESYDKYNNDAILSFYSIDKQGINVSGIWDKKFKKYISNNTLYSDYSLYSITGRPSNSFCGINFAALDEEKRKFIVPKNDMLIEFDYDAFHVRLIANLIDYKFPEGSAHDHLAKLYSVDREEGKKLTFQYLYGGIPWDIVQLNPFFGKVKDLTTILWKEFNKTGKIETPIYKRPMFKQNHKDITKTKLFNYYIQATETEQNIKTIIKLQRYLYTMKSNLILYTYDSFLIDFNKEDGAKTLKKIKKILESDNHLTKSKVGFDYGSMKDASHKL
jgi:hypothetical protein